MRSSSVAELDSERFGPGVRAAIDERLLLEPSLEDEGQNALRRAALPLDAANRIRAGITCSASRTTASSSSRLDTGPLPELIVVGGADEKLVVLEKHARLNAFALRPEALPPELDVLLGRSLRISDWACW